jgi:hypothetical protein
MYAFDGPLPAPPTQEVYNGFFRRLARLGHAYCIVLGLLAILAARARVGQVASWLLVIGACATLLGIGLEVLYPQAPWLLVGGPAVVVLALVAMLVLRDDAMAIVPETAEQPADRPFSGEERP